MKKVVFLLVMLVSFSLTYANPIDPSTDKDTKSESIQEPKNIIMGYPFMVIDCGEGNAETLCGPDRERICYVVTECPDEVSVNVSYPLYTEEHPEEEYLDRYYEFIDEYGDNFYADKEIRRISENRFKFTNVRNDL